MTKRPIDYRPHRLVLAIASALYEADGNVPAHELEHAFPAHPTATVKNTIGDLVNFGAVRRVTPLREQPAYRLTPLGRAWLDRELEPFVGPRTPSQNGTTPEDL